ncbi:MAG: CehA/McbA family metallohydrolase [Chloroflexi bacterium]|nr:CehA/McbA family metallohydrolase [Chloroflexota bacterium]
MMHPTHAPDHVFNETAGWYAGDFHAHTTCSDGQHTPAELVALAVTEGLDFLTITDHNNTDAFDALDAALPLPVLRGVEVTLPSGHFNVIGLNDKPSWLQRIPAMLANAASSNEPVLEGSFVDMLMDECRNDAPLVSLNHPLLKPWEWNEPDIRLSRLTCVEIWNDPTWPDNAIANPATVDLWSKWLNAGYRITAIGGSDFHFTGSGPGPYLPALNLPRTVVFAQCLSAAAILEGVRQGRVYVTMEPLIRFHARANGHTFDIGDDMPTAFGEVQLEASVQTMLGEVSLQIIKNGEIIAEKRCGSEGQIICQEPLTSEPLWVRCDVRDGEGRLVAVTNPIFGGKWPAPPERRFRDFFHDEQED